MVESDDVSSVLLSVVDSSVLVSVDVEVVSIVLDVVDSEGLSIKTVVVSDEIEVSLIVKVLISSVSPVE